MHVVIKVGGCNGSGKTTLARAMLKLYPEMVPIRQGAKIRGYVGGAVGKPNLYVLGSYENVCGGMDTISDKEERLSLVRRYAEMRGDQIVFFEGLITGKTYGAFGVMSEEPKHMGKWLYAFMDTPFDVCVERVLQRRAAKGNTAPFDPERTMRPTFKGVAAVARRAAEAGHKVVMVNHKSKPETAARALLARAMELYDARR